MWVYKQHFSLFSKCIKFISYKIFSMVLDWIIFGIPKRANSSCSYTTAEGAIIEPTSNTTKNFEVAFTTTRKTFFLDRTKKFVFYITMVGIFFTLFELFIICENGLCRHEPYLLTILATKNIRAWMLFSCNTRSLWITYI